MPKVICFVGVVTEVEASEDAPEQEIAGVAREQVFARLQNRDAFAIHDFGVEVYGLSDE